MLHQLCKNDQGLMNDVKEIASGQKKLLFNQHEDVNGMLERLKENEWILFKELNAEFFKYIFKDSHMSPADVPASGVALIIQSIDSGRVRFLFLAKDSLRIIENHALPAYTVLYHTHQQSKSRFWQARSQGHDGSVALQQFGVRMESEEKIAWFAKAFKAAVLEIK